MHFHLLVSYLKESSFSLENLELAPPSTRITFASLIAYFSGDYLNLDSTERTGSSHLFAKSTSSDRNMNLLRIMRLQ